MRNASAICGGALLALSAITPVANAQEVRPSVVDPNFVPAPYVPLTARFGYYPLYNPVYNRAYFTAWADAYAVSAAALQPTFRDPRTTVYAPDYAAYYYTSRYYPAKYSRYYWYYSAPETLLPAPAARPQAVGR